MWFPDGKGKIGKFLAAVWGRKGAGDSCLFSFPLLTATLVFLRDVFWKINGLEVTD